MKHPKYLQSWEYDVSIISNDSLNLRTVPNKATLAAITIFESLSKIGQKTYKVPHIPMRQSSMLLVLYLKGLG